MHRSKRFCMLQLRQLKNNNKKRQLNSVPDCYFVLFMPLSPCQPLSVEVPGSFAVWFQIVLLFALLLLLLFKMYLFSFGCAWSLLLHNPFSRCGKWRLASSCVALGSHCGGFFWLQNTGSRVPGLSSCSSWAL